MLQSSISPALPILPSPSFSHKLFLPLPPRIMEVEQDNKMTSGNLGIVFGPTLMRPRPTDATISLSSLVDYPHQARIIEALIIFYPTIFEHKDLASASRRGSGTTEEVTCDAEQVGIPREGGPQEMFHKPLESIQGMRTLLHALTTIPVPSQAHPGSQPVAPLGASPFLELPPEKGDLAFSADSLAGQ